MKQRLTYEELEEAVRRLNRELAKMKQAEKTIRRSEENIIRFFMNQEMRFIFRAGKANSLMSTGHC